MVQKVCRWASWAEWSNVYKQLLSQDAELRSQGVRRICTWRSRGRVPVAIDLTGSYVEIMLNDPVLNPATKVPRSDSELRLMYSMAMVRLVNGIVDVAQQGGVAKNIFTLAEKLAWPRWFVELRHAATHQDLPTLPVLRLASQEALFLLFERFWRPQLDLVEQRGHGVRTDHQGRTDMRPVLPPRDVRLLKTRLKGLTKAASSKRKATVLNKANGARPQASLAEVTGPCSSIQADDDQDQVDIRARLLAELAPDESRLLKQVFETTLAGEPSDDGREVRVLDSLCEHCSDNFVLRVARQLVDRALLSNDARWEPVADGAPALRSICDSCSDRPRVAALAADPEDGFEEAERMLRWIPALLAHRGAPKEEARLLRALSDLSPLLRRSMLQRLTEAAAVPPQHRADALAERAVRLWHMFREAGIDRGADFFISVCSGWLAKRRIPPAPQPGTAVSEEQAATSAVPVGPTFETIETAVRALKQRRSTKAMDTATVTHEPWTAIGTMIDQTTLDIHCWPERSESKASIEAAAGLWRAWAEEDPTAPFEEAEGSSNQTDMLGVPGATVHEADADVDRSVPPDAQLAPSGAQVQADEDAKEQTQDELAGKSLNVDEIRSRTAGFFSELTPLGD
mmetsp:Transcript_84005/g.166842  ORF Transcript_84005/g.166842 Transcript_84005/m.166842 type:complete len:627 (-) Transcript_84005:69-1949(-)|eukprot:CAMPEP_0172802236 /NCGR_PEP_ID=MMETSP1075-20121228/3772_1 /TAXON_ID=2916 /ORGANISM="Ceratium fusus, Strain PA161109" /LENGTH=626 /DNA_ID=CAMNT_0013640491 /DNA_START=26 /DNA_END=1906 /DNA_ORIENTATION=-